jgi:hypothetical protein
MLKMDTARHVRVPYSKHLAQFSLLLGNGKRDYCKHAFCLRAPGWVLGYPTITGIIKATLRKTTARVGMPRVGLR